MKGTDSKEWSNVFPLSLTLKVKGDNNENVLPVVALPENTFVHLKACGDQNMLD